MTNKEAVDIIKVQRNDVCKYICGQFDRVDKCSNTFCDMRRSTDLAIAALKKDDGGCV